MVSLSLYQQKTKLHCLFSRLVPVAFEWRFFHCIGSIVRSVDVLFISLFWWWEFGTHGDSNPCAFQLLHFHSHQWQPTGIFGTTTTSWKLGLKIFRCRIMKQIERNCFHPNPSSWWKVLLGNNCRETLWHRFLRDINSWKIREPEQNGGIDFSWLKTS